MKRNDWILISTILVVGAAFLVYMSLNKQEGGKLVVTVHGEIVKELPLLEDTTYTIESEEGKNILTVKDGYATITEADCPDHICEYQQAIHYDGDMLICLPHQVIVTVEGGEERSIDNVAN